MIKVNRRRMKYFKILLVIMGLLFLSLIYVILVEKPQIRYDYTSKEFIFSTNKVKE
jgi:hypothetical protein